MRNNRSNALTLEDQYKEYYAAKMISSLWDETDDWGPAGWNWKKPISPETPKPIALTINDWITYTKSGKESSITESPFEQIEEFQSDDDRVKETISCLKSNASIHISDRVANRLEFLFEVSKEEEPEEIAILPESLKNFISFLNTHKKLKYPDIVLSPSKNIRIQWKEKPRKHFSIEFLPTGDTVFVIFYPDSFHKGKSIRLSGISHIDSLMDVVKPHGVLSWIKH